MHIYKYVQSHTNMLLKIFINVHLLVYHVGIEYSVKHRHGAHKWVLPCPCLKHSDLYLPWRWSQWFMWNVANHLQDFLVLSFPVFQILCDALQSAEPILLELDRNLQVLLPSQAAKQVDLPPAFFNMTADELKREQQMRFVDIFFSLCMVLLYTVVCQLYNNLWCIENSLGQCGSSHF